MPFQNQSDPERLDLPKPPAETFFHLSFSEKDEAGVRVQGNLRKIGEALVSAAKSDEKLRALFSFVYAGISTNPNTDEIPQENTTEKEK